MDEKCHSRSKPKFLVSKGKFDTHSKYSSWLVVNNNIFSNLQIRAAKVLGQTLRRYTGLNHLAQAARAVLQSPAQIVQMKTDFGRVDFENVHSQASWVTHCEWKQVSDIHQSFVTAMSAPEATLEKWADWLEQVLNDTLDPHVDGPYLNRAADDFLLKWSFYG